MNAGIVFDIKKFSLHDGPGIRTTVFLKGCPLTCVWCHNPEGIAPGAEIHFFQKRCIACGDCAEACPNEAVRFKDGKPTWDQARCQQCGFCAHVCPSEAVQLVGQTMTVPDVIVEIEKDVLCYDQSGGGVTFSGGEPCAQPEFLKALLQTCQEQSIHTAVDTSGLAPLDHMEQIAPLTDLFLFDLKMMNEQRHERFTGVSNRQILENLGALSQADQSIRVRIPIIPGINDDQENIVQTTDFLTSLETIRHIDLLPYHPIARSKYQRMQQRYRLKQLQAPTEAEMERIAERFRVRGFQVTIGG